MLVAVTRRTFAASLLGMAALAFFASDGIKVAGAQDNTCRAEDFSREVDAAGEALRRFNAAMTPELDKKLQALKSAKGWSDDNFRKLAQDYLFDARTAALDQKANTLLTRLDELGSAGEQGAADCAKLSELKATGAELLAVMKAKSSLTLARINEEIAASRGDTGSGSTGSTSGSTAGSRTAMRLPDASSDGLLGMKPGLDTGAAGDGDRREAQASSAPRTGTAARSRAEPVAAESVAGQDGGENGKKERAGSASAQASRAPAGKSEKDAKSSGRAITTEEEVAAAAGLSEPADERARAQPPQPAARRPAPDRPVGQRPGGQRPGAERPVGQTSSVAQRPAIRSSDWAATTQRATPPVGPPGDRRQLQGPQPLGDRAPSTMTPGDLALNAPPPSIENWERGLPPPGALAGPEEGYTVEEIRDATRGFFGTISTNLAAVLEHAFANWGRPTGYVLGQEGGGAFLAGLRYGKGQLYMRSGLTAKVYWHGPSVGYDFGAEGSRTMFLIYSLQQPDDIYRRFTGVDGSAFLVGGFGVTLLKGGPVILAPIRSGVGLRLGANIGYLRFSSEPTWNPF